MVAQLTVLNNKEGTYRGQGFTLTGCHPEGKCGNGLEKIYPTCAVRYGYMRYIGEFKYAPGTLFNCGGKVVVQTVRGMELGEQVSLTCTGCEKSISRQQMLDYVKNSGPEFFQLKAGRILRVATQQDIDEQLHLNQDAARKLVWARQKAAEMNLPMKFVTCEHLLGGERVVYHFMAEGRVDFRELVRILAREYHTRIEMHQVGARDEARLVADYEICGRECCCKNFLKKLRQVNMKMAKLQKATLDPSKVSGRCGRLRCCLRYEHEGYEELNSKLPRVGARVRTERGVATVRDRQILTQLLVLDYEDGGETETIGVEAVLEKNVPWSPPETPAERPAPRPPERDRYARGAPRPAVAPSVRQAEGDSDFEEPAEEAAPPDRLAHGVEADEGQIAPRPADADRGGRRRRRRRRGRRPEGDSGGGAGPEGSPPANSPI